MAVLVVGPRYKPTKHLTQLDPKWRWLRSHTLAAFPMWERGGTRIYNTARPTRWGDITFGAGGDWQDMLRGPALHFAGAGIVDLGFQRIGSLGLFAASTEQWTAVMRFRVAASAVGSILARASATSANKTFQLFFDRPTTSVRTPNITLRGTGTDLNWGLDDGLFHTIWVTWDGTTAKAYYDDALGVTTLGVGTAAEESQNISLAARTVGAAGSQVTGDIDFIAFTDFAANPPLITKWHHDLYAPWRPYRRPVGKSIISGSIPGTDIQIVYPAHDALRVTRVELWTDVAGNGGEFIGPIQNYTDLTESSNISGEHTVTLGVHLAHPIRRLITTPLDTPNLHVDQVIRLVKADGSYTEHRISEATRQNQAGVRRLSVTARSIYQDLALRGLITRTTADGATTANPEVLSYSLNDHIEQFVMPALAYAGARHFDIGTLEYAGPVDMVYDRDTPLSALKKLASAPGVGDLELEVRREGAGYTINLVKQIGLGLPAVTVRAKRDLIDLTFSERGDDQATRIACFGAAYQDQKPTLGLARWDVVGVTASAGGVAGNYDIQLADPSGGKGPIAYDNQFLPAAIPFDDPNTEETESLPLFHLQWTTGTSFMAPIIATFASTQKVRIQSSTAPPVAGLLPTGYKHKVKIVADGSGAENLFIDYPAMVTKYGVRIGTLDRPDIPATDNLIPNPIGRAWPTSSPLPTGWQTGFPVAGTPPTTGTNATLVSMETNPLYAVNGGKAIRYRWPGGAGFPLRSPLAVIPYNAQGYLSFFARVTTLKGKWQLKLVLDRKTTYPDGTATPSFPVIEQWEYIIPDMTGSFASATITDVSLPLIIPIQINTSEDIGIAATWDLTRYPLYGGTAAVLFDWVDSTTDTEFIVSAVQLTNTAEQLPLFEGNAAIRLHQAANERLALYGPPAPVVSVNVLELAHADGLRFPYPEFQLGAPIIIQDPDSDVSVETRIVGIDRDWENRMVPNLQLSNERRDITSHLAAKPRGQRHRTNIIPALSRGNVTSQT